MVIVAVNPQPMSPTWSELEVFFLGNCITPVQTPAQTLAWRKVRKPGNIMSPHALYGIHGLQNVTLSLRVFLA